MHHSHPILPLSRRQFIACAPLVAAPWLLGAGPRTAARPRSLVAREPWADIEKLADGVWAVVSKPLEDLTTVCNGGIIAGDDGVLVVESFGSPRGAAWVAGQARELTGRAPDVVIITHYHGDHVGGLTGTGPATVRLTARTRELVRAQDARRDPDPARSRILDEAILIDATADTAIELGGRVVRLVPRDGHTASDVTVHVDDARIVFCGDLVWTGFFPNYVDATPSRLADAVEALWDEADGTTFVAGHGAVAEAEALAVYVALISYVEDAAREAVRRGMTAAEAAAALPIPASYGEWHMFNPRYYERAIGAWLKELGADA